MSENQIVTATPMSAPAIAQPRRSIEDLLTNRDAVKKMSQVATKYVTAERVLRLAIFAVKKTPALAKCSPSSVLGCCMFFASIGIEPNNAFGHGFLIPFEKKHYDKATKKWVVEEVTCTPIIGYKGYIALAYREPVISKIVGGAVYERDEFEYQEGSDSFLRHRKLLIGDRGPLVAAFGYAKLRGEFGDADLSVVLPRDDVMRSRGRSKTYTSLAAAVEKARAEGVSWKIQKAERALAETPWVFDEDVMAAKTGIRRLASALPIGGSLAIASAMEQVADTPGFDPSILTDVDVTKAIAEGESSPYDLLPSPDDGDAGEYGDGTAQTSSVPDNRGPATISTGNPEQSREESKPQEQPGNRQRASDRPAALFGAE